MISLSCGIKEGRKKEAEKGKKSYIQRTDWLLPEDGMEEMGEWGQKIQTSN